MEVELAPGLDQFVAQKVKCGDYQNASEVIRESLRRWKELEQCAPFEPEWLEQEIIEGLGSPRSEVNPGFWADLRRDLQSESDLTQKPGPG